MADEWRDCLVEDLAAPVRNAIVGGPFGSDLVSADYASSGVPVIRGENLSKGRWVAGDFVFVPTRKADQLAANTAGMFDIVFTQRGANHYRQVAMVRSDAQQRYVISQSQMKLTVDREKAEPLFVYYVFRTPHQQEYLKRHAIQTGVPHTNLSILRKVPLRVPPLKTQRAIAHILGTLDDKIELNRRMNETLEAMARALFKSWFVDFDPVRAKAEGRDPALPKPLADLFPDSFEDSELGEIPRGWSVEPLRKLACYLSRGLGPAYVDFGGICVLNQKCIRDRRVDFSKARRHDASRRSTDGRLLQVLDVLVNSTGVGTLGRIAQLWDLPEAAIVDSHVTVVRAAAGTDPWFLGIALTGREAEVEMLGEGSTGQTELSRARLGEMACLVPPVGLQARFARVAATLIARQSENQRSSDTLATLRDTLLPKLISGELRLKNMEESIEEAI